MAASKYVQLIQRLIKRTEDGTANWEPTSRDGVFALSLSDFTVRLSALQSGGGSPLIHFEIVNSLGTVVDKFTDADAGHELDDAGEFFKRSENMYDLARRKAFGVDAALDSLLAELDKDDA